MIIGIDYSTAAMQKAGIGYYTSELSKNLAKVDAQNTYILFTHQQILEPLPNNVKNVVVIATSPNLKWIIKTAIVARKHKIDIFVSPSFFMFGVFFPKTIQILHDISPILFPESLSKKSAFMFKIQLFISTFFVKHYCTISHNTKKDFVTLYPRVKNKVSFIGTGLHSWIKLPKTTHEVQNKVKEKYGIGAKKIILSVSTLQPRKNYVRMITAFSEFSKNNKEYVYVIVGQKGWMYHEIEEAIQKSEQRESIKYLGYIPEEDLLALYDSASIFLFASIYEGFGLPPIEAYARGLKIIVSDILILKEVMQDKAMYVDPLSVKSILEAILSAKEIEKSGVDSHFLDQYDWEKIAKRLVAVYSLL